MRIDWNSLGFERCTGLCSFTLHAWTFDKRYPATCRKLEIVHGYDHRVRYFCSSESWCTRRRSKQAGRTLDAYSRLLAWFFYDIFYRENHFLQHRGISGDGDPESSCLVFPTFKLAGIYLSISPHYFSFSLYTRIHFRDVNWIAQSRLLGINTKVRAMSSLWNCSERGGRKSKPWNFSPLLPLRQKNREQ